MNEENVITQWLMPEKQSLTSHGYVTNQRWLFLEMERIMDGTGRKCILQHRIFKDKSGKRLMMRLVYK